MALPPGMPPSPWYACVQRGQPVPFLLRQVVGMATSGQQKSQPAFLLPRLVQSVCRGTVRARVVKRPSLAPQFSDGFVVADRTAPSEPLIFFELRLGDLGVTSNTAKVRAACSCWVTSVLLPCSVEPPINFLNPWPVYPGILMMSWALLGCGDSLFGSFKH